MRKAAAMVALMVPLLHPQWRKRTKGKKLTCQAEISQMTQMMSLLKNSIAIL